MRSKFYILFNLLNNLFPKTAIDTTLAIKPFIVDNLKLLWDTTNKLSSPSRKLSDLFWISLPWDKIEDELGKISLFDTGCGNGTYYSLLNQYSGGKIKEYTGIDILARQKWDDITKNNPTTRFFHYDGKEFIKYIQPGANFFITQSALEHFEQDLFYFDQLKQYISTYNKSVIQIHLLPSSSCLSNYGPHGIRQYTPRSISAITKMFKPGSDAVLYLLGGKKSNEVHQQFITRPLGQKGIDRRETDTDIYDKSLFEAINHDMHNPVSEPAFYALIIHSNARTQLFKS